MFRVGQKVVLIGTKGTPGIDWDAWCAYWKIVRPTRGIVYTVRDSRVNGRQFIRLVEIVNPVVKFKDAPDQEPWWWAEAFRPIISRPTSIAVFEEILRKVNAPALPSTRTSEVLG